jgi:hypothetical protein
MRVVQPGVRYAMAMIEKTMIDGVIRLMCMCSSQFANVSIDLCEYRLLAACRTTRKTLSSAREAA